MSAAIGKNGRVAWSKSFGFADVGAERPPTDTTAYHLALLTKLFGAVVLLRLADSGLVSLDDSVSKFGITLPNDTGIRVRHLLSMTSGGATPGERFAYNGDRFALLERVIRQASGKTFAELATLWITTPLGMSRTAPNVDTDAFEALRLDAGDYRRTMAKAYSSRAGVVRALTYPRHFSVSAGMISTPSDMVRFAQALDAGTILSAQMRDLMFTPVTTSRGDSLPYALGCFSQQHGGTRVVWAYGLWTSISSLLIHLPERGLTFVILANADRLSADYRLGSGALLDSPVAQEFLNSFVFNPSVSLP